MIKKTAAIKAIRFHLPDRELTNDELLGHLPAKDQELIFLKTGVSVRHIAAEHECASDLGVRAAERLFASGACAPQDIDFLLFCSQAPDHFLPTTACILQHRLGLPQTCGALDFNLGCSGFVYGLALAKGLIEIGLADNVLLITADTYSKFLHPTDLGVRTIFGDGAAATLISGVDADRDCIGPFVLGTDGKGAQELIVPAGGMRTPPCTASARAEHDVGSGVRRSACNLYMNGPEIFSFMIRTIPTLVTNLLKRSALTLDDVDFFVFHQASRFGLDHLRRKIRIPEDKFCLCLEPYGNTVSSTIPIALATSWAGGRIDRGSTVMLVGFGVGLSWAAAMMRIPAEGW